MRKISSKLSSVLVNVQLLVENKESQEISPEVEKLLIDHPYLKQPFLVSVSDVSNLIERLSIYNVPFVIHLSALVHAEYSGNEVK